MVPLRGWTLGQPVTPSSFTPRFTWIFTFFAGIMSAVNFTFAAGGAGYESIPFHSTDFNSSGALWYEDIVHWVPKLGTCEASSINPGEGSIHFLV
jgi:hypothetical protein